MQDGAYVGLPGNEGDCAGNEALVDHHEDDPGDQQWQHQRGRHHQGATGDGTPTRSAKATRVAAIEITTTGER